MSQIRILPQLGSGAVSCDSVTTANSLQVSLGVPASEIELLSDWRTIMPTLQSKYEMKHMVLAELVELCKKLIESSAITEQERTRIRGFVNEFDSLMSMRDKGRASERFEGTELLEKIARFLPQIAEDYRPEAYLDRGITA